MHFMIRSQFSYVVTSNTQFTIAVDKLVLYQKAKCDKCKELLIEEDEDAPSTRYVNARPRRLFKHEFEALKMKTKHTSLVWFTMRRFYRLKAYCPVVEPNGKPSTYGVHHQIRSCYQTLNHLCFTKDTPFNMIYSWTREFNIVFDYNFTFGLGSYVM